MPGGFPAILQLPRHWRNEPCDIVWKPLLHLKNRLGIGIECRNYVQFKRPTKLISTASSSPFGALTAAVNMVATLFLKASLCVAKLWSSSVKRVDAIAQVRLMEQQM